MYKSSPFTNNSIVICKIIVGAKKAPSDEGGWARRSRDEGIVRQRHKTIPQSEIKDFCQPPLGKGALSAAEKEKDIL